VICVVSDSIHPAHSLHLIDKLPISDIWWNKAEALNINRHSPADQTLRTLRWQLQNQLSGPAAFPLETRFSLPVTETLECLALFGRPGLYATLQSGDVGDALSTAETIKMIQKKIIGIEVKPNASFCVDHVSTIALLKPLISVDAVVCMDGSDTVSKTINQANTLSLLSTSHEPLYSLGSAGLIGSQGISWDSLIAEWNSLVDEGKIQIKRPEEFLAQCWLLKEWHNDQKFQDGYAEISRAVRIGDFLRKQVSSQLEQLIKESQTIETKFESEAFKDEIGSD